MLARVRGAVRRPRGAGGISVPEIASANVISSRPNNCSASPLPQKLGIRPGHRIALLRAPEGFEETLGELPGDITVRRRARGPLDVILAFVTSRSALDRGLRTWRAALDPAGGLWIAWPKRSSGVETDLSDGVVRETGLAIGLVDNKVCVIDATWSALRFVVRLADRPG